MKRVVLPCLAALVLVASGCSKKIEKPPVAVKQDVETFSITSTNTVVEEEAIPVVAPNRMVRADFNMDSLEDMAIAEQDEQGENAIAIYLRRRTDDLSKQYFKAGGIKLKQQGDYTISALISQKSEEFIDLLVMFNYPDDTKEMVHYRTDGKQFREVLRKPIERGDTE